ncbi:MAG: hypothetical protein M3R24_20400 [Chloroflexota bacterium]|nr:hypothetical protein [Chloroflexota bacterium]
MGHTGAGRGRAIRLEDELRQVAAASRPPRARTPLPDDIEIEHDRYQAAVAGPLQEREQGADI